MIRSEKSSSWSVRETQWLLLLCCALASAAVRGFQKRSFEQTHTLMGSYFAGFYFLTYATGGRRRALIGSILAAIHPGGLNIRALNMLGLVVLITLLAFFIKAVLLATSDATFKERVLHLALCGGVIVSIQWEVLGDLLQIDILLFFLASVLLRRFVRNSGLRLGLTVMLLIPLALVHEAAIFLFPAFLPFVSGKRPEWRQFAVPIVFALILLGISLRWGSTPHYGTHGTATAQATAQNTKTPPFSTLLEEEGVHDFGSARLIAAFGSRFMRIISLLSACLIVCATAVGSRARGFLQTFLRALLVSLPLWLIAHDWGRFVSDLIILTFYCEFLLLASGDQPSSPFIDRVRCVFDKSERVPALIAGVSVLLFGAGFEARVSGMGLQGFLASLPFIVFAIWTEIAFAWWNGARRTV